MRYSRLRAPDVTEDSLVSSLKRYAEPLPATDSPEFAALFDRFGDARVVLIGEASHGTSEFYCARNAITRRLIEQHGFNIVATEADWPDAAKIDRYVRLGEAASWATEAFKRFPTWMWRNRETAEFADWLRQHNDQRPEAERVEFRGLDVYSLGASLEEVLRYLHEVDPKAVERARERYSCLTPWQHEPARYARHVAIEGERSCEAVVVEQLQELLDQRLEYLQQGGERFFDAERNARVVVAAEEYYRTLYRGSTESWNLRDRHMFDTLKALLSHRGEHAKAVVWAHNSHIGNAAATSMGWGGEFNIGELCRTAFGREAVLIGQFTDRGEVAAADNWDEPMRIKPVRPARDDSWEKLFLRVGQSATLTDWRDSTRRELRLALSGPRLERAIGVIYRPHTERQSHYFQAILAEQFDALLWFEQTRAVEPIASQQPEHTDIPETYPFGE